MPELKADKVVDLLRKENIETPVILTSALKTENVVKKGVQSFLHKPIDRDTFVRELSKYLKHEMELYSVQQNEENKRDYQLVIPEILTEEELELILELNNVFKVWKELMELTAIEKEAKDWKQVLEKTNLKVFIPFLNKLQESAASFNMNTVDNLLSEGIHKTEKK